MQSDQYKRDIANLDKAAGKLRDDIGKQEKIAGAARVEASKKRQAAGKATSDSMRNNHLRNAKTQDDRIAAAEKKIGELQGGLGSNASNRATKEISLRMALGREQSSLDRAAAQRQRKEKTAQTIADRAAMKRRDTERAHAREVGRLGTSTVRHVMVPAPEPEKLRVLYLTASPATDGAVPLRVDVEVNNVLKTLRGARYRDLIELSARPAATIQDLVDGLNDHRPHVVHFSGHAGGGLLFDNADMIDPGEFLVGYEKVARILQATDHSPRLIVLNGCETLEGAEFMLEAAPVVIAMSS